MAAYTELLAAARHDVLNQKVRVACFIAADKISVEPESTPNHALRMAWAKSVYANPELEGNRMVWAVVAKNAAATAAAITGASDAQVQINVDLAINLFAS